MPTMTTKPLPPTTQPLAQALAVADREVPEYRQLIEQIERDLRGREAALDQRRSDLVVGMSRQAAADDLTERARRLIEDDVIPRSDRARDVALKDIETLVDELRVTRVAIAMQEAARDRAHYQWSLVACRGLAALHARQVQAIDAAAAGLRAALVAHGETMDGLTTAGVMCIDPVTPHPLAGATLAGLLQERTTP